MYLKAGAARASVRFGMDAKLAQEQNQLSLQMCV